MWEIESGQQVNYIKIVSEPGVEVDIKKNARCGTASVRIVEEGKYLFFYTEDIVQLV